MPAASRDVLIPMLYPAVSRSSLDDDNLPRLVPSRPPVDRHSLIDQISRFVPSGLASSNSPTIELTALRAGLFLWHDFLDESHKLSQSIEGEGRHHLGDYWHAIMHRREPDYSNAKYWFRRISPHGLYRELAPQAEQLLAECRDSQASRWQERLQPRREWDAFAFVDLCEECADDEDSTLAVAARRIQLAEMKLLIEFTYDAL